MASYFDRLVGNDALRRRLGAEIAEGTYSHAYIIEGPRGSGKHTLAREIAKATACLGKSAAHERIPCGSCKFCRKIEAGTCPDVITVKREGDRVTMGVEVIRAMRESVHSVPNELDVKVYIIEDAHTMTPQAQNAFLLTLEEPPSFVLFLLLAEDASALLETVRSRAPVFRMQHLDTATLREHLMTDTAAKAAGAPALAKSSPEEFEELLMLADGKIGAALALLDPKKRAPQIERRHAVMRVIDALADPTANDRLFFAIHEMGLKREELRELLSMLTVALRDLVLLTRTDHTALLFFTNRERALDLTDHLTATKLLSYLPAVEGALEALLANANTTITMTNLLARLLAARQA